MPSPLPDTEPQPDGRAAGRPAQLWPQVDRPEKASVRAATGGRPTAAASLVRLVSFDSYALVHEAFSSCRCDLFFSISKATNPKSRIWFQSPKSLWVMGAVPPVRFEGALVGAMAMDDGLLGSLLLLLLINP